MKQDTKLWITIAIFMVLIAGLSAVDLGLNIIGLIPGVGDVVKTASETVIEIIQVSLAGLGFAIVALLKR